MYTYDHTRLIDVLKTTLDQNLTDDGRVWLHDKALQIAQQPNTTAFYGAFTAAPRYVKKIPVKFDAGSEHIITLIIPQFSFHSYTTDRLARVWLLLNFPPQERQTYVKTISGLFKAAEMNEQVALYGALPLLAYPEEWIAQCADGIRSNIGSVLEAIMCNNPYPAAYLPQPAWNQLILKAFFTEKPVEQIIGLDERANRELAYILSDYAHERWAAGRTVNPQLWRLVAPFLDERLFPDVQKMISNGTHIEKKAAILACYQGTYSKGKELLNKESALMADIESGRLNWNNVNRLEE